MRHAIVGTLALVASGCATLPTVMTTQERVTRPAVGEVTTREIGEALFVVEIATRSPGLRLLSGPQMPGPFGSRITWGSQELLGRPMGNETWYCGPASVQPVFGFPQSFPESCQPESAFRKSGVPYKVEMVTRIDPANFRQELLYQGKSGNTLKISYREFSGDLARPAFSQDLTFDLSEGAIIGTKGARIEVLEATNTSIKYRLQQPFASR